MKKQIKILIAVPLLALVFACNDGAEKKIIAEKVVAVSAVDTQSQSSSQSDTLQEPPGADKAQKPSGNENTGLQDPPGEKDIETVTVQVESNSAAVTQQTPNQSTSKTVNNVAKSGDCNSEGNDCDKTTESCSQVIAITEGFREGISRRVKVSVSTVTFIRGEYGTGPYGNCSVVVDTPKGIYKCGYLWLAKLKNGKYVAQDPGGTHGFGLPECSR